MIQETNKAPDFIAKNQENEEVKLLDFSGKNVVLYFYPKDNTPSCTKEASGFADLHREFAKHNTEILGVSTDSTSSHAKFARKLGLPFQLLSDAAKEVVQLYDVWKEKSMYGKTYMGVERTTFVIDSEGVIRKIFPKVKVPQHAEAVLEYVKSLEKEAVSHVEK